MWKIRQIEQDTRSGVTVNGSPLASVTLYNGQEEKVIYVPAGWLARHQVEVGGTWQDHSQVALETEDLVLKKAKLEDWAGIYHNLWCHPESARYMLWDVTTTEEEAMARMEKTIAFQNVNRYALFVYEKESGQPIGFAGMQETEPGVFEETGIALGPAFTGRGYGTQVLMALTQEAKAMGAHTFRACCRRENIASHRMQMRCGFIFAAEEVHTDPGTGEDYRMEINVKRLDLPEDVEMDDDGEIAVLRL